MMVKAFVIVALAAFAHSAKLPPFFKKLCAKNDKQCGLEVTRAALPDILNGYKPLRMISLNPFKFERFDPLNTKDLLLSLRNGEVSNLNSVVLDDLNINFETNVWNMKGSVNAIVDSDYEVHGKILILPIEGEGKAHIEFLNVTLDYTVHFNVIEKKDKHYLKFDKDELTSKIDRIKLHFENLFNGDKTLGDQVNSFLNENWREVEFQESLNELIKTMARASYLPLLEHVPIENLFL